ncbi:hypothetical protein GLGCALEP_03878 [Pseudomonas sp. MM221]|nr:hypothetical protein GLGCALEP_03878 [Pseudomonas sp. MM221]
MGSLFERELLLRSCQAHATECSTGQIPKGHPRPKGNATARVVPAHHAVHVVTHCKKPGYRLPRRVQHAGRGVCAQAGEGAKAAWQQFNRVKRPFQQWPKRRVGCLLRFALGAVIGRRATLEGRVFTLCRRVVETVHRALQLRGIDPAALRQLCQRCAAVQVATTLVKTCGEGKRFGPANAVAALRGVVADQPGFRGSPCGVAANSAFMKSW